MAQVLSPLIEGGLRGDLEFLGGSRRGSKWVGRGLVVKAKPPSSFGIDADWVVCNIGTCFRQRQTMSCRETAKCRSTSAIDTEIQEKRNIMISELTTCRITKAKAKVKYGPRNILV